MELKDVYRLMKVAEKKSKQPHAWLAGVISVYVEGDALERLLNKITEWEKAK